MYLNLPAALNISRDSNYFDWGFVIFLSLLANAGIVPLKRLLTPAISVSLV
jgi:hypothetical protein